MDASNNGNITTIDFNFNTLPDGNDVQRATLVRELSFAHGFTLLFAICNDATERSRQIASLCAENPTLHIQEVPIFQEIPALHLFLQDRLENPLPDVVCVYGMESWIRNDTPRYSERFILNLNVARNHFPTLCPCPLLLWIPEYLFALVAESAPDFFSVRSGIYRFTSSSDARQQSLQRLESLGDHEMLILTREQRESRIEESKNLLYQIQSLPDPLRLFKDEIRIMTQLADLYYQVGQYSNAETLYHEALAVCEKQPESENLLTATILNNLAGIYRIENKYTEAEPLCMRAMAIYERLLGTEDPRTAICLNNLAELYRCQSRYVEAEPLYLRALAIFERHSEAQSFTIANTLNNLAALYWSQGKFIDAENLYLRALNIFEQHSETQSLGMADCLNNLAALEWMQGKYAEAEPLQARALAIYEQQLGAQHPDTQTVMRNYSLMK